MISIIYVDDSICSSNSSMYNNYSLDFSSFRDSFKCISLEDLFFNRELDFEISSLYSHFINRVSFECTAIEFSKSIREYRCHVKTNFDNYIQRALAFKNITDEEIKKSDCNLLFFVYTLEEFNYLSTKYDSLNICVCEEPQIFKFISNTSFDLVENYLSTHKIKNFLTNNIF